MGASSSTHETILRHADQLRKLATLSYDDFLATVEHLNLVAEQHVDPQGKRLMFAIRHNSADTILWKATVRIDCYKVNCKSGEIESARILTLNEFVMLYNQIIIHIDSASVNPPGAVAPCEFVACTVTVDSDFRPHGTGLDTSILFAKIDALEPSSGLASPDDTEVKKPKSLESVGSEGIVECCICMERKSTIILPCSHTYCEECIDNWCESHNQSCPICRQRVKDKSDQWVLMSDRPDAKEVEKEVSSCVLGFAERAGRPSDDHG